MAVERPHEENPLNPDSEVEFHVAEALKFYQNPSRHFSQTTQELIAQAHNWIVYQLNIDGNGDRKPVLPKGTPNILIRLHDSVVDIFVIDINRIKNKYNRK